MAASLDKPVLIPVACPVPGPSKRLSPAACRRLPVMPVCLDKLAARPARPVRQMLPVTWFRPMLAAAVGRPWEAVAPAIRQPVAQRRAATWAVAAVAEAVMRVPPMPERVAVMDLSGWRCTRRLHPRPKWLPRRR